MEAVRAFNNELSSLYETRPPVSRAKMASVTKHAIKAIKFYKHVVQSVEKFVQKCKPEYKVPGLYVIDSIVRQSRHQFGSEKDVFGPRFTKNIVSTFQNLFKCPQEEKSRVIRVLNLWQKNAVFPVEVIQPLLDLAADPNNVDLVLAAQRAVEKVVSAHQRLTVKASNGGTDESLVAQQSDIVNTVTKLLQQTGEGSLLAAGQESQLQQLQLLQQQLMMQTEMMSNKPQQTAPVLDNNLLAQIKLLTDQLLSKTSDPPSSMAGQASSSQNSALGVGGASMGAAGDGSSNKRPEPGFNKKLLDFDYGDSDEEDDRKDDNTNVQALPGGVHKLLSDPTIMQHIHNVSSSLQKSEMSSQELLRKQHLEQQQEEFNKEISLGNYKGYGQQDVIVVEDQDDSERERERDYDRDRRRSRRSRDRSRSPRRRRHSRSHSRERRRSRDRHRRSRSRDHDRERQREKDRERKKKGLPPNRDKCISVCTRTLWFGHLAKHTTEEELRAEIEKYGPVETINMVPPRGCAYVCMARRKDAAKALDRMKGFKLNSSALRVAWAPGIGVKESSFKDLWDMELGVTCIPWNKMPADLTTFLDGAIIDDDSLPDHLKGSLVGRQDQDEDVDHRQGPPPDGHNLQMMNPMPNFAGPPAPGMPPAQQMSMMPPPMMMPIPGQSAPSPQVPPLSAGQIQLPGHLVSGQPASAHPGRPPNILPPQLAAVSTAMSLSGVVSLPQAVSAAASLLGAPPNMLNTVTTGASLDGLAGGLGANSSAPLLPPGQQPGLLARPGLPPPGAAFGLPPNMRPHPGFPLPGQGLRLPSFPGQDSEIEEPKEWPADDKMLEEEALAEMEEDIDHRIGMGGDAGKGPTPLMSLPMMGMRMRLPGPGPRMPMQVAGGAPRPGVMLEVGRPETSAGIGNLPMGPGGAFSPGMARPGLLGPRVMRPGMPQDSAEGVLRSPLPGGIMGAQGPAMGLRLGMGAQSPGSLPLGQRMPGMPGAPGLRGIGGQGPIRILLGNQQSPRGPGGLGVRPGLPMGDVPTSLGQLPNPQGHRGVMEDGQGLLGGIGGPNQGQGNGPVSQAPGLLQNLMMGAALRGGRPGLLGLRPNMPVNGGFRFGPQQPGGLNFRGPRPDFPRMLGPDKPQLDGPPGAFGGQFGGGHPGDDGDKSPEYGEGFDSRDDATADTDMRDGNGRPGTDLSSDVPGITKPRERAGRQSRWSDVEKSEAPGADGPYTESNGPTSEMSGLAAADDNQTGNVLEGASEG